MKKIIWGLLSIPVFIIIFNIIPIIFNFAANLIRLDNIDFGFSLWMDIGIDLVAGLIAYFFAREIFGLSKREKETWTNVLSIIIGFIIGIIVHIFLKYWIWILLITGLILIATIVCYIIKKKRSLKVENKLVNGKGENT